MTLSIPPPAWETRVGDESLSDKMAWARKEGFRMTNNLESFQYAYGSHERGISQEQKEELPSHVLRLRDRYIQKERRAYNLPQTFQFAGRKLRDMGDVSELPEHLGKGNFFRFARKHKFRECPTLTGFDLLPAFKAHPTRERLWIATKPLADIHHKEYLFFIEKRGWDIWIGIERFRQFSLYDPDKLFCFVWGG